MGRGRGSDGRDGGEADVEPVPDADIERRTTFSRIGQIRTRPANGFIDVPHVGRVSLRLATSASQKTPATWVLSGPSSPLDRAN